MPDISVRVLNHKHWLATMVVAVLMFMLILQPRKIKYHKAGLVMLFLSLLIANIQVIQNTDYVRSQFILPHFSEKEHSSDIRPIRFNPDAPDRWMNTVYVEFGVFGWFIENHYEAGLGTMIINKEDVETIKKTSATLNANYLVTNKLNAIAGYELFATQGEVNFFRRNQH